MPDKQPAAGWVAQSLLLTVPTRRLVLAHRLHKNDTGVAATGNDDI